MRVHIWRAPAAVTLLLVSVVLVALLVGRPPAAQADTLTRVAAAARADASARTAATGSVRVPAVTMSSGDIPVTCAVSTADLTVCILTASTTVSGASVQIGSITVTAPGPVGSLPVDIELNSAGQALVAKDAGVKVTVTAQIVRDGGSVVPTATATTTVYPGDGTSIADYEVFGTIRSAACTSYPAKIRSTLTGHLEAPLYNTGGKAVGTLATDVSSGGRVVTNGYRWCAGSPVGRLQLEVTKYWNWANGSWGTAAISGSVDLRYATSLHLDSAKRTGSRLTVTGTARTFGVSHTKGVWRRDVRRRVQLVHVARTGAAVQVAATGSTNGSGQVSFTVPSSVGQWWLMTTRSPSTVGSRSAAATVHAAVKSAGAR